MALDRINATALLDGGVTSADLATQTGNVDFADNAKIRLGDSQDLQIYHDGGNSFVDDTGTGSLFLRGESQVIIGNMTGEQAAVFNDDGAVTLNYDNSQKLATTSTGVDVTGTVTADAIAVEAPSLAQITVTDNSPNTVSLYMGAGNSSVSIGSTTSDPFTFLTANTERMRLDSSGNLLLAKTSAGLANVGHTLAKTGYAYHTRDGAQMLYLNRLTDFGTMLDFRWSGTTVGVIGVGSGSGSPIYIGSGDTGLDFESANDAIRPISASTGSARDNAIDLGRPDVRFDDIYATNGTIQTSDANEKQQIAALTDAEITAAKAISALFKTFKWNSAVEGKGDAARTHVGVIAQDVEAAMTAAGLDAGDYAFFTSNTWWETQTEVPAVEADEENDIEAQEAYTRTDTYDTAEEAPDGATERTRMGIRYPELLAFVGAATEQRLGNIETRLEALENA